jgi:hypothetical protein
VRSLDGDGIPVPVQSPRKTRRIAKELLAVGTARAQAYQDLIGGWIYLVLDRLPLLDIDLGGKLSECQFPQVLEIRPGEEVLGRRLDPVLRVDLGRCRLLTPSTPSLTTAIFFFKESRSNKPNPVSTCTSEEHP